MMHNKVTATEQVIHFLRHNIHTNLCRKAYTLINIVKLLLTVLFQSIK